MNVHEQEDLQRIYQTRFAESETYRRAVWQVLTDNFFQNHIRPGDKVLDLGCGYGEFINQIKCGAKFAMDLNPDAPKHLSKDVKCFLQDCSSKWPLPDGFLDVVFTSNFFEHLPDKMVLGRTLDEILRCLAPGGRLIAMGPNIKYIPGKYWEFWDHHIPLTENALWEALKNRGMQLNLCYDKFLPYTMAGGPRYPLLLLRLYLNLRPVWRLFGQQFLVIASKP